MDEHEGHRHHHPGEGRAGERWHRHGDEPCGCGHAGRRRHHHDGGEGCGGRGEGPRFRRRFLTREERIERLEVYLKQLKAEAQAVEEQLAELRS